MTKKPAVESELVGSINVEFVDERLLEVIEAGDFADDAAKILSSDELDELKREVATFRQLGSVIEDTNGLRKFRYGAKGKGKSGGARVLYYYGGDHMPVFLIAIYPKSEKANITGAEKKAVRKLIKAITDEYRPQKVPPKLRIVKSEESRRR